MGDAAHPFTPFAGLGSSQALVDAFVLAEGLLNCKSMNDAEDAFVRFEVQRLKVANGLMDESRAICSTDFSNRMIYWTLNRLLLPALQRLGRMDIMRNFWMNDSKSMVNALVPFRSKEEESKYRLTYERARQTLENQVGL